MARNVPPVILLPKDIPSTVRKSHIEEMSTALQSVGIPAGVFQPETYLRHGYTEAHFTAQEMGWIAMFETQRNDLARRLDDVRRDHKAAIDDLELQLCEVCHQLETGLTQIKEELLPASLYTPLYVTDFNKACWTEYTVKCRLQKKLPVAISHASLHDAVLKFGDPIKHRHIVDYLDVGNRKQQLQDYMARRSTD